MARRATPTASSTRFLWRGLGLAAVLLALGAFEIGSRLRGGAEGGEPTLFRPTPGRQGAAVELLRGKSNLFVLLQRFADFTGEPTYYAGNEPPDTTITIPSRIAALNQAAAQQVLEAAGYDLSRERYREREVYWVQRGISNQRRTGGLRRRKAGELTPERLAPAAAGANSAPGVSLFQRREGSGTTFLVTYETSSREAAEDAVLVLEALTRKRPGGEK